MTPNRQQNYQHYQQQHQQNYQQQQQQQQQLYRPKYENHHSTTRHHPYSSQSNLQRGLSNNQTTREERNHNATRKPPFTKEQQAMRYARSFFQNVLQEKTGLVRIKFESERKYGQFDLLNGYCISTENIETNEDIITGIARLWQIGIGLVFVRHETHVVTIGTPERLIHITVFQISDDRHIKMESVTAQKTVMNHPLWRRDLEINSFIFD
ncbi:hypothetical protein BDK51DRAFT_30047 [Blyttiomyces helicus]|uniref:Uncharacterized protein n=1 Tax=Blyttiomyces helicus TaxID=388810 RepID=A0A4P9WMS7_9FUNG|nr:hypothetical protein BDK51DRAFT_30047 [Blyttiomyces helicus]|eukprot:RKO94391.1 hypothetical protein BDK51DRAFT_30047 [Blyttiomyces helicus]